MLAPDTGQAPGHYDAVILAGGLAQRLGGLDKPGMLVGGQTLVATAVGAVQTADTVIVVGPRRPELVALRPVASLRFVSEDPPGLGPVPALARGLAEARAPWVAVLAADLPFLRTQQVHALLVAAQAAVASASPSSGAVLVDADGSPQWLVGCWRTRALTAAVATHRGSSLHGLFAPLRPAMLTIELAKGSPPPWLDCDTPTDLELAQAWPEG
jgi:molybdopterin-guanine dinucleotide biosynthesis protein A